MSLRVKWMDQYAAVLNTTGIGTTAPFTIGSMGIATSKYAIPLIGNPDINPGQEIIDQRKAIGIAQRSVGTGHCEFLQGTKMPTTTWEFDGNAYNLPIFLWTLFQKGSTEDVGADKFIKIFNPATASEGAECEAWLNVLRKMEEGSSANSIRAYGMIARSMTLSSEGFSPLKVSVELVGAGYENTFDAGDALFTYDSNCGLVWGGTSGATATLGGSTVQLDGFEITVSNNAIARHYGQNTVQKFVTGDITVEGSITVFWGDTNHGQGDQITDFINGTDQQLIIYWGSADGTSVGDLAIKANIRYTGAEVIAEDEIATTLPFIGVYDGTNNAIDIIVADGIDRSIP